jgi:hypothetical protein
MCYENKGRNRHRYTVDEVVTKSSSEKKVEVKLVGTWYGYEQGRIEQVTHYAGSPLKLEQNSQDLR